MPRPISRRPGPIALGIFAIGMVLIAGCGSSTSSGQTASSDGARSADCAKAPTAPAAPTAVKSPTKATAPVTVTGTPLVTPPDGGDDPAIGCAAPIIDGQSFSGQATRIGGPTAKPTVVVIAAHWCPHCNNEVPKVAKWVADGGLADKVDVVVLSTSADANSPHYPPSTWLSSTMDWTGATLADSAGNEAAKALGVAGFPTFVLLTAQGRVADRMSGEQPIATVDAKVQALLATSAKESKSVPSDTTSDSTTVAPNTAGR